MDHGKVKNRLVTNLEKLLSGLYMLVMFLTTQYISIIVRNPRTVVQTTGTCEAERYVVAANIFLECSSDHLLERARFQPCHLREGVR
jgi:hypothetical protein